MILYCSKCNNLVDKTNETLKEGEIIERKCSRCGLICHFVVQYRAVREEKMSKLTDKGKYDIM